VQRKVDTLKNAGKSTFKVYKLGFISQLIEFIDDKILAHPNFLDKNTTSPN